MPTLDHYRAAIIAARSMRAGSPRQRAAYMDIIASLLLALLAGEQVDRDIVSEIAERLEGMEKRP